jgi:hypothetical protein
MAKTYKKKLFRVDAALSYLILTEKDNYTARDFLDWAKSDMHSGEFDDQVALKIEEVKSTTQIQNYVDLEHDYMPYDDTGSADTQYLSELITDLGLDAEVLADRLRELGYTVTPPVPVVSKPKTKNKTK